MIVVVGAVGAVAAADEGHRPFLEGDAEAGEQVRHHGVGRRQHAVVREAHGPVQVAELIARDAPVVSRAGADHVEGFRRRARHHGDRALQRQHVAIVDLGAARERDADGTAGLGPPHQMGTRALLRVEQHRVLALDPVAQAVDGAEDRGDDCHRGPARPLRLPPLAEVEELAQRQGLRRLHRDALAIDIDIVGLGVDLDVGQRVVVDHVALGDGAAALHRHEPLGLEHVREAVVERGPGHERVAGPLRVDAEGAVLRPVLERLAGHQRARRVAHDRVRDEAALQRHLGLGDEELGPPEHQVRELARRDRAHVGIDAEADRRVDRHLGEVALDPEVVVALAVLGEPPEAHLVDGCELEGALRALRRPPHALAVGADHADRAHVVQHVLGPHGLRPGPALNEGDVRRHALVQVVAGDQHVDLFVVRVDRERVGRVGRARQQVGLAADPHHVGRVAAAGAFAVVDVHDPAVDGGDGVLVVAGLVQRVGVDLDLEVVLVGELHGGLDGGRRGRPVLVDLEARGAGQDLLHQRARRRRVALAEVAEVERDVRHRLQHALDVEDAGAFDAHRLRPRAAADHRGEARVLILVELLHGIEVRVDVDEARRADHPFHREDVGVGGDDQPRRDVHGVRVAGLADADDLAVEHADVALHHAEDRVDDHGVGDHHVEAAVALLPLRRLAHAVADGLAAAEDQLVAIGGVVVLDLGHEAGIGEVDPVSGGRPVLRGVVRAGDLHAHALVPHSRRRRRRSRVPAARLTRRPCRRRTSRRAASRPDSARPRSSSPRP